MHCNVCLTVTINHTPDSAFNTDVLLVSFSSIDVVCTTVVIEDSSLAFERPLFGPSPPPPAPSPRSGPSVGDALCALEGNEKSCNFLKVIDFHMRQSIHSYELSYHLVVGEPKSHKHTQSQMRCSVFDKVYMVVPIP